MKNYIESGKAILGIEFGSTRIKAVLINDAGEVLAVGGYDWENSLVNGIWTYSLDEIYAGLKGSYASLKNDVKERYGITLKNLKALGISGMMHGYLPFDDEGNLLANFRTWRNTITGEAADILTEEFNTKNEALRNIAKALSENNDYIIEQNIKDIENGRLNGMSESMIDRLTLTKERIDDIAKAVLQIVSYDDLHSV